MKIRLSDVQIGTITPQNSNMEMLNEVRALLYNAYVKEQGWIPSASNPSGIRIVREEKSGRMMLVDNFDEIARWIVAIYQGKIIACARTCRRVNGKFEAQYYSNAACLNAVFNLYPSINLEEVTRGAVAFEYRSTGVYLKLLYEGFKRLNEEKLSIFTMVPLEKPKKLYRLIEFPEIEGVSFKYEERDEASAQLFLAIHEKGDLEKMVNNLGFVLSAFILANENSGANNIFVSNASDKKSHPKLASDNTNILNTSKLPHARL